MSACMCTHACAPFPAAGSSVHQKLDRLSSLLRLLGYDSLAVFGDCFDEVTHLDPVQYPGAIKVRFERTLNGLQDKMLSWDVLLV